MLISGYEQFKDFKEHNIAEFFRKNRQMLGFVGKVKSLTMVVHELVTNSLDAAEKAGILPEITVRVTKTGEEKYVVEVKDNGPGIPYEYIPDVFGKMLKSTKFEKYQQSRGKQGIGASAVTLFSQMTTGEPTYVVSRYIDKKGRLVEARVKVKIDTTKNEPEVVEKSKKILEDNEVSTGLYVRVALAEVLYRNDDQGVLEYLKRTAIVNPHATIRLIDPDRRRIVFRRSIDKPLPPPKETKPHPNGVSADDLLWICKSSRRKNLRLVLMNDLIRVSPNKIEELKKLLKKKGYSPKILEKPPSKVTFEDCKAIVSCFKEMKFMAPPLDVLRPLGEKYIRSSMKQIYKPNFVFAEKRKPSVYWGGVPFLIEGAIAYVEKSNRKLEILRFANNVPLLFDNSACVIFKEIKEFPWKNYGLSNIENMPVKIMVHVVSTHIPYTSAGKQAIADVPEIRKEIHLLISRFANRFAYYMKIKSKLKKLEEHKKILKGMIPLVVDSLNYVTGYDKNELKQGLELLVKEKFEELDRLKKRLLGDEE